MSATQTAKALFDAYASANREAAERLIAEDFRFTSPFDNGLDRAAYFEICWPGAGTFDHFKFVRTAESDGHVFVVYEASLSSGKTFRNCESITVRNGKIAAVEVYFGWNVPHEVAPGRHKAP